jgi:peroxiredoxin Q/BCP
LGIVAKIPAAGTPAPDFTLPSVHVVNGVASTSDLTLSDHRGETIVLAFYPGDETAVCTKQLCSYTTDLAEFSGVGAQVWAISPQDIASHESFARHHALAFPLLADVHKQVINEYGVAMFGIGVRRSVFVVDGDGIVRWNYVGTVGIRYPDAAEIARHVREAAA